MSIAILDETKMLRICRFNQVNGSNQRRKNQKPIRPASRMAQATSKRAAEGFGFIVLL
jgi:hypothetical protein